MATLALELLLGLVVAWAIYGMMIQREYATRVLGYAPAQEAVGAQSRRASFWKRVAPELAAYAERVAPTGYIEYLRTLMRQAGRFSPAHVQAFLACQVVAGVGGALGGSVLGGRQALIYAVAGGAFGLLVPWLLVRQTIRRRQEAISAVLPDTLDLLTASVEAGLGLDAAIAQVAGRSNKACWAMNQELTRYLQESRMGVPRAEALRGLGVRAGLDDLRQVVTALVQGDMLGVGVSQILRAQTQHLRMTRKQRAEEKAMKAPIKILFPLLFGIFPAIFILILGPAVIKLWDVFVVHAGQL